MNYKDISHLSFRPFIDLQPSEFSNLTAQSAYCFLENGNPLEFGPAMHIYSPFRYLLHVGGLNIEYKNFENVETKNGSWKKLIKNYKSSKITSKELLLLARTTYYLGFVEQSENLFHELKKTSSIYSEWSKLYLYLIGRSQSPNEYSFDLNIFENTSDFSSQKSVLNFSIHFNHLIYLIRNNHNEKLINGKIDFLYRIIIEDNIFKESKERKSIALARLLRYISLHAYNLGDIQKFEILGQEAIKSLNNCSKSHNSYYRFLASEGRRRIFDAITIGFLQKNNKAKSLYWASKSLQSDPFCPRANMILAEANLLNKKIENKKYFFRSQLMGTLERYYSRNHLITPQSDDEINAYDLRKNRETSFYSLCSDLSKNNKINGFDKLCNFPIKTDQYDPFVKILKSFNEDEITWRFIKSSESYKRFLPYYNLQKPLMKAPDIAMAPIFAYKNWQNQIPPYFNSIALQRMPMPNFREALFHSSLKNKSLSVNYFVKFKSIDSLYGHSKEIDSLILKLKEFKKLKTFDQNYLARCVGNLGYVEHALELSFFKSKKKLSVDEHYLLNTHLFYQLINNPANKGLFKKSLYEAFLASPLTEETLRSRFSISMIAIVFCGQRDDKEGVSFWRPIAFNIVKEIERSQKFSDFDKCLLLSRFYRAACYKYFSLSMKNELLEDAYLCEKFAREARPVNEDEHLLNRDNLYSMLDSMQRIHDLVGDYDRALHMLNEVNYGIDTVDSKFWLSQGDFFEKHNQFSDALECFIKSGMLEVPMGRIGWFRAGLILEDFKELELALDCYLRSVEIFPEGISPIQGILRISTKLKNYYLKGWAENQLKMFR